MIASAVALVVSVGIATPARADPVPGRIAGTSKASVYIITSTLKGSAGTLEHAIYRFTPKCSSGPCATTLTRKSAPSSSTVTLKWNGSYYTGETRYQFSCIIAGKVKAKNSIRVVETFTIYPKKIDATTGKAGAITGFDAATATTTAKARSAGCKSFSERASISGLMT